MSTQGRSPSLLPTPFFCSWFHRCFVVVAILVASHSSGRVNGAKDFGIIEWIRSADGGYVHPFQEYQEAGMVATQPIPKGEILATIPWSHILMANEDQDDPMQDPSFEGNLDCNMVKAISREISLGKYSYYAPAMMFLLDASQRPPMNHLPSNWTVAGKNLLNFIATDIPPLEPTQWLENDFYQHCKGKRKDATAALLTIQWAQPNGIVPLLSGMYPHRNGDYTNADTTTYFDERVDIVATRDIEAGETIYISQNLCKECDHRHHGYGTAEILRDFGFIESMPQRWHYRDDTLEFDIDYRNGTYSFQWVREWDLQKEKKTVFDDFRARLGKQIRQLRSAKNVVYVENPGIPQAEWDTAWAFQQANVLAMTLAQKALYIMSSDPPEDVMQPFTWHESEITPLLSNSHYHSLEWEIDTVAYVEETTCPNDEILDFAQHSQVERIASPYQQINFMIDPISKDVLLELDNVVQIASSYRPQYHEYMIHSAARFVDSVKRIVFVGGGDSMLLHDALKYPDLELVVGLELDQWVTRKSFQYFHTQPHFDDPRVEWWFGDATKSLLLLPKDYWNSFDLVLVDLSETVMSLSVTDDLDVFDALALLLRPTGVLVKNEVYIEEVSKVFDYSMQIVYESPIICEQILTMASHTVDFFHAPVKDHGIPTLLYVPLIASTNRLDFLHGYRTKQQRVSEPSPNANNTSNKPHEELVKSAGILEIIDAENITGPLDDTLVERMERVVVEHGFEIIGSPVKVSDLVWIMMKEGYILARLWPSRHYCSMDINLWGRFDRLHALQSSLTLALESPVVSKFRVVVGGMFGSSTWNDDRNSIGPPRTKVLDSHETQPTVVEETTTTKVLAHDDLIVPALEESLEHIVQTTNSVAVAICGPVEQDCLAVDVLKKSPKVTTTIRLSACPGLDSNNRQSMYDCEIALASEWSVQLNESGGKTQIVMVDDSAPYPMLQIIDSLLSMEKYRKVVISDSHHVFMAWSTQAEPWRKMFLENYRRYHKVDPVRRAEYGMPIGEGARFEFGVVACGDPQVAYAFQQVETNVRQRYPVTEHPISVEAIYGGKFPWIDNWAPTTFYQSDYDTQSGLEQYFAQEPLAHHVVFQLDRPMDDTATTVSMQKLSLAFSRALKATRLACIHRKDYSEIGEGRLMSCLDPNRGSLLLTWDGRTHVDVSLYCYTGSSHEMFLDDLKTIFASTTKLSVTLLDEMPRGPGRTINRRVDLKSRDEYELFFRKLSKRRLQHTTQDNQEPNEESDADDHISDDDSRRPEPDL